MPRSNQEVVYLWELYNRLIEGIPADISVNSAVIGIHTTIVDIGETAGLAQTLVDERRPRTLKDGLIGKPLREVASLVRSWNFTEASLGLAALCAWYNVAAVSSACKASSSLGGAGQLRFLKRLAENRRVAMTCEMEYLTQWVAPVAQLSLFAEVPAVGSYPMLASEYLMQEQDLLLLSGDSFVTKRLPRLLELSTPYCETVLVGFGVPMADCLWAYGIDEIATVCVTDATRCRQLVQEGATPEQMLPACSVIRHKAAS